MNEIARRFGHVFWGLFLVILDLNLDGFDVLPDFLGYGLVAVGAGGLTGLSGQFVTARICAWVLVFVAIAALFPSPQLAVVIGLIHLVLNCIMVWSLLGGVMDYSTARDRPDLAERASTRRVAYVALMSIVTLLGFAAGGGSEASLLAMVIVVALVVLLVMILHLIHRVKTELAT